MRGRQTRRTMTRTLLYMTRTECDESGEKQSKRASERSGKDEREARARRDRLSETDGRRARSPAPARARRVSLIADRAKRCRGGTSAGVSDCERGELVFERGDAVHLCALGGRERRRAVAQLFGLHVKGEESAGAHEGESRKGEKRTHLPQLLAQSPRPSLALLGRRRRLQLDDRRARPSWRIESIVRSSRALCLTRRLVALALVRRRVPALARLVLERRRTSDGSRRNERLLGVALEHARGRDSLRPLVDRRRRLPARDRGRSRRRCRALRPAAPRSSTGARSGLPECGEDGGAEAWDGAWSGRGSRVARGGWAVAGDVLDRGVARADLALFADATGAVKRVSWAGRG